MTAGQAAVTEIGLAAVAELTTQLHLTFAEGHASTLLYAVFRAAGVLPDEELMTGYRRFASRLEGHPSPVLPWVDMSTGSLGQGLADAVGIALAGRYLIATVRLPGPVRGHGSLPHRGIESAACRAAGSDHPRRRRSHPTRPSGGSRRPRGHRDRGRVIELYSVKPDTETLRAAATDGRFVVAEDHHLEAGLRSIVTDALPGVGQQPLQVAHLAVREMPGSGTGAELMAAADIEVAAFIPSSITGKVANVCRQRYQGPRSRPGTRSPSPQGLGAGRVAVVH